MNSARDQQIRALFRAALERPAAERASFIADLSGGDDEIRKSVELMLSQHGATDLGARAANAPSEPHASIIGEIEDAPYDVAPDGQRFLVNEFVDPALTATEQGANAATVRSTIAVIVNWACEL